MLRQQGHGVSPHCGQAGQGSWWVLPGSMIGARTMNGSEFQAYHAREAARLRRLIANATTPAVKTRLIEQAEEHERLAEGFEEHAEAMADA